MTDSTIPEWTLGWRMRRALAHAGISIEEMAAELGVSRSTASGWINEHHRPNQPALRLWALRAGVPYEWLRTGVRRPGEPSCQLLAVAA